jgi:hypothetical protein
LVWIVTVWPPCARRESEADDGRARTVEPGADGRRVRMAVPRHGRLTQARTAEPRRSPANGGGRRERILAAPTNPGARREWLLQAPSATRLLAPPGAARLLAPPDADPNRRAWQRPTRRDKTAMGIPSGRSGERWVGPTRSSLTCTPWMCK